MQLKHPAPMATGEGTRLTTAAFDRMNMTTQSTKVHQRVNSSHANGSRALQAPEGIGGWDIKGEDGRSAVGD